MSTDQHRGAHPNVVSKIQVLPETLIDQIAAGEVIERPSSAVKELVENSLDAGATRIEVSLHAGGIEAIVVSDNGHGMSVDDLTLCIQRHATSKIRCQEDLTQISSFGFRGEALSSIASVSRMTIASGTRGGSGAEIQIEYGICTSPARPAAVPSGTRIEIRDLFSRVPARHKFLKSAPTEFSHCARVLRELALGNPGVRFLLVHADRRVAEYIAPDPRDRIRECLKSEWEPIEVIEETDGMHLSAFLVPPDRCSDRCELWIYINRRAVRNRTIQAAVRQAYAAVLGIRREPTGVLYLDIRTDWVDPNAHPQKLEVRLLQEQSLYSWIGASVRKALCEALRQAAETVKPGDAGATLYPPNEAIPKENRLSERQESTYPKADPVGAGSLRYLGQAHSAYLICEDREGIVLVDAHALAEKTCFEAVWRRFEAEQLNKKTLQPARIVSLSVDQMQTMEAEKGFLASVAIDIEPFGSSEAVIRAVPDMLPLSEVEDFLREVLVCLRDCSGEKAGRARAKHNAVFATLACRSVVRPNEKLSPVQAQEILGPFDRLETDWICPHGRPVAFRMPLGQIRKHFERL